MSRSEANDVVRDRIERRRRLLTCSSPPGWRTTEKEAQLSRVNDLPWGRIGVRVTDRFRVIVRVRIMVSNWQ